MILILDLFKLSTNCTIGYIQMAIGKRCRRDGPTKIELSSIKSTSTCISLGLTIRGICCDNCRIQLDAKIGISKKSSVPAKRFRDYEKSGRNRCQ